MPIKNFYTVRPDELQPGDVLVCTVTLHVGYHGDPPVYRMYRCGYPPAIGEEGIPQGSAILSSVEQVAAALFPVVRDAGLQSEY
jgi:hypothetical protein